MKKNFTTSRRLRTRPSKYGHQIQIRVKFKNGKEFDIPVYDYVEHERTPVSIRKNDWQKGQVISGNYGQSLRDLNLLISQVEYNVRAAIEQIIEFNTELTRNNIIRLTYIREDGNKALEERIKNKEIFVNADGGAFGSEEEFVEHLENDESPQLDGIKKAMGIYKKIYILDYWDDFINNYAPDSYNSPKHSLEDYINRTGDNCRAEDYSEAWLNRFFKNIIEVGYSFRKDGGNRRKISITTIRKYKKQLSSFGDYLFDEERVLNNQDYKRFKLKGKTKKVSLIKYTEEPYINTHALYKSEFDHFYSFCFEDEDIAKARDMFVMQTWLGGMRQSDFYDISQINFHKDANGDYKLWFSQNKTSGEVLNVINKNYLIPIIEKYGNKLNDFPKVADYNKRLKKGAKIAGLNRKLLFKKQYAKDDNATIEWHPIYEKILNKWARNCAVSILVEMGYPDNEIRKFVGHKDDQMINHYKQMHPKIMAQMMANVKPEKNYNTESS